MTEQFKHLFSPLQIGSTTVKNRIVMTSHTGGLMEGSPPIGNEVGERYLTYLEKRAKGGAGLIGTQGFLVHPDPKIDMFSGPWIQGLKRIVEIVHTGGAKTYVSLAPIGPEIDGAVNQILEVPTPWAASPISSIAWCRMPHQVTINEINGMVGAFGKAARVARDSGFDALEIHACHGTFLWSFISPYFNSRSDEYGGSVENRLRIVFEVIDQVRKEVGKDYTVGMRITGDEFIEGGITLDDMQVIAPMLTEGGGIDFLSVSQGVAKTWYIMIPPMNFPLGSFAYVAAAIKRVVDIPVITVGRINDPVVAENILQDNHADLIGMARALVCDPELPNKSLKGDLDGIRKCIGCLEGCWGMHTTAPMTCAINPVVGHEHESGWGEIIPAVVKKKVMVIGGGPGGLEAARVARMRSHTVTLYERGNAIGGNTLIACMAPGREDFGEVSRYYSFEMKRLGVDVHLGVEVTAEMVRQEKPDAVVVATGSIPKHLNIPGSKQENVIEVKEVLRGDAKVGHHVVVIDGDHGVQALSTADLLATQGKRVDLICEEFYSGIRIEELEHTIKWPIYQHCFEKGVNFRFLSKVKEISGNMVIITHVFTGEEMSIEKVDTVVYASGDTENNELYYSLRGKVKELYAVGDCVGVRKMLHAVRDGATVGRNV